MVDQPRLSESNPNVIKNNESEVEVFEFEILGCLDALCMIPKAIVDRTSRLCV